MPARSRDAARRRGDFVGVAIAGLDDAHRQRVRGEDHQLVRLRLRRAHALGERLDQQRMSVERLDRLELRRRPAAPPSRRRCTSATLSVENCGASGMPITRVDAGRGELGERVLDERLPVAHADGDRHVRAEPRAQRRGLRLRDVGERRASADRAVVLAHLVHELG